MSPKAEQEKKLVKIIKILRKHDDDMKQFFDDYVFNLLGIDKRKLLNERYPYLRFLFLFSLITKPFTTIDRIKKAIDEFNKREKKLIKVLNANVEAKEKFKRVSEIVYNIPYVGQKVGSLFLELLILYGGWNKELLPYLYVPIDKNVYRTLRRLGLDKNFIPNPERHYQVDIHGNKFQNFQKILRKIAEANRSYRVHFDYLWYVGHEFCKENLKNCEECWMQSICPSENRR